MRECNQAFRRLLPLLAAQKAALEREPATPLAKATLRLTVCAVLIEASKQLAVPGAAHPTELIAAATRSCAPACRSPWR